MTTRARAERPPLNVSFREAMASVCTPVSVVTTLSSADAPHGTTVSAFASLSMKPPMIMVSLDRGSGLLAHLRPDVAFGLNILGSSQADLALRFAGKGAGKFEGVSWTIEAGAPRISGSHGFVAGTVSQLVQGGDHMIVLGTVCHASPLAGPPLTYHARRFGTHMPALSWHTSQNGLFMIEGVLEP